MRRYHFKRNSFAGETWSRISILSLSAGPKLMVRIANLQLNRGGPGDEKAEDRKREGQEVFSQAALWRLLRSPCAQTRRRARLPASARGRRAHARPAGHPVRRISA